MIGKLIDEITKKNAPVVVGLDPQMGFLPKHLLDEAIAQKGESLEAAADAFFEFNRQIIDAVYDLVPAVKPQSAMYEMLGTCGEEAYKKTIDYAHSRGLIVIGDIKRADIGSTSEAYAIAHIGKITIGNTTFTPFNEDFCTVNPYLGTDGVKPFVDTAKVNDRGIFVLVKTSNPSSGEFQDRLIWDADSDPVSSHEDARSLYELVGEKVEEWGADTREGQYSNVGAVVGATYPEMGAYLRKMMPHTFILVPGYGAQGGKGKDLKGFFDKDGVGAIINSSRGIIAAYTKDPYKDRFDEKHFADASRQAVIDMLDDVRSAL